MIYFVLLIFILVFFCAFMSMKYRNPYKLIMIFGKKGSGKSTLLTKLAVKYLRQGKNVYSTFYIPGTYLFDVNKIGVMQFPANSVIIIDEVGMIWDNRNFKAFRTDVRDWFKYQRQYRNIVILASQTFDIDVKLRNLTDRMYLCKCHMGFLSVAKRIKRDIVIVKPTGDTESRIADSLEFEPLWMSLFGAQTVIFTYIPHWTKVFKSFNPPELVPIEADYQEVPVQLLRFYHMRKKKPSPSGEGADLGSSSVETHGRVPSGRP